MKLPEWLKNTWNAPPRGYVPGNTLARVAHDLSGLRTAPLSPERWRFDQPGASWHFDVLERVSPQFLMHIVSSRFIMLVADSGGGQARIRLTHRGAWRRNGLNWTIKHGEPARLQPLLARLDADAPLYPLDPRTGAASGQCTGEIAGKTPLFFAGCCIAA